MEAYKSVTMEAFRERYITADLLSYKEVLFEEATEEWYAQRDPIYIYLFIVKAGGLTYKLKTV